jgi:Glyoxalase-like domain
MSLEWEQIVVDAAQPATLGRWWANALGWVVTFEAHDEFEIRPNPERLPGLLFVAVGDPRLAKNRLHPDFRPDDQAAEVDRLLALGARRADVGQGEQPWVVLADPEGNEFCVLASRGSQPPGTELVDGVS